MNGKQSESLATVRERLDISREFAIAVSQIEAAALSLSAAETKNLAMTPVRKPAGYADQGYRHG